MNLADKNVLVIGAARSGIAAAKVAKKFGAVVTLSDAKENLDVQISGVTIRLDKQTLIRVPDGRIDFRRHRAFDVVRSLCNELGR